MKKLLLAAILPLLLCCAPAFGQITKGDSCATQAAQTGCSLTVSGSNKYVIACVTDDTATALDYNVTVAGAAATLLRETTGTGQYAALYYYSNPADGTPLVDSDGGTSNSFLVAQVYYGVDIGGTPFGTREGSPQNSVLVESASAASSSSGTIATQANDLVATCMSVNGSVTTAQAAVTVNGSGGTNEEVLDAAGTATVAYAATQSAGTTATHAWLAFPGNRRHSNISVNLHSAVAPSGNLLLRRRRS